MIGRHVTKRLYELTLGDFAGTETALAVSKMRSVR